MLLKSTYVRCAIDASDLVNPRDFAMAKIINVDEFAETAELMFYDLYNLRQYYENIPITLTVPISCIAHCKIAGNSIVKYGEKFYEVKSSTLSKKEGIYYYYLYSTKMDKMICIPETEIIASFNDAYINPIMQMQDYELQNPIWYFGRNTVYKTAKVIENSIYGFKELAGCKIYLMPHQLKTVMRCLSEKNCRYMIADEVGMGKTVEAAAVLKVYITDHQDTKILVIVPDALIEQWRTELAFKFRIFEGKNVNGNMLDMIPSSEMLLVNVDEYDFIVFDEVHRLLNDENLYNKALALSKHTKNIIMLSATPIQSRNEEYHRLLTLIQPKKYECMVEEKFITILNLQTKIIRKIYTVYESLDDYITEIEEADNQRNDDLYDLFQEIIDDLIDIAENVGNSDIEDMVNGIDFNTADFGVQGIGNVIAFICEAYQLEKSIIRNRRSSMGFDTEAVRDIEVIPYDMEDECNNTEYSIYLNLVEWIENSVYEVTSFKNLYLPVIKAFFSSSIALLHELEKIKDIVPAELAILTRKWNFEENLIADNITDVLEKSDENYSRLVSVIDYLDQELYDKKTLIFTDYQGTFELYKNAIVNHFGDEYCCFFNKNMSVDELELNVYRFQTDDRYKIMLSDKSGGEGRNFQIADALIHIDLPWSANDLEQRIGRLDRIGREKDKPVISVVCCAQNTVEQDLFGVWNDGLKIFSKSQSGLEIIMPEIDEQIIAAFSDDLKYGVHSIVNDIVAKVDSLQDIVKRERHFDVAQYKYQTINKSIERTIQRYRTEETELFALSMMSWAQLTGFKGRCIDENTVQFMPDSFSMGSAYNTWFIPPDMKKIIDDKMNQMQNRVREMSNNKKTFNNSLYILGTFSREQALKSDYLHFFAPGDEIYDSITQNALRTYKGKCTAIAVIADIRWEGFIYSWNIEPDILSLLENDIPLRKIEQYKGFIPSEPVLTAVSVADDNNGEDVILGQFAKLQNMSMSEIRSKVAHLGRRGKTNDFLKIKAITGLSNLEYFKQAHPSERWQYNVQRCFKIAKDSALKKYKGKIKFKELKAMLYNQLSEDKAAVEFYGGEFTNEADDMVYRIINEAFCKSKITLDSVCYVKMIRGRDNG